MKIEMMSAIIELVRDGGSVAVWITALHYLTSLGRYLLVMGGFWAIIKTICNCFKYIIEKENQ